MRLTRTFSALAVFALAGWLVPASVQSAESKDSVTLVSGSERSQYFAAVNKNLDLGGKLYGYVDVDGDTLVIAEKLRRLADQIATVQPIAASFLKQDYAKIFDDLGISDVKAVGLSSVEEAKGGFRNRVFFYTPNGRHGLLSGLGGPAAPYVYSKNAPADADLYAEGEVDVPAVYAAVKAVVTRVVGETTANLMDTQLKAAGAQAGVSALEVIQSLKGRGVAVLRFDGDKVMTLPGAKPVTLPAFSLLIRIDGLGGALDKALSGVPLFKVTDENGLKLFSLQQELPVEGLKPVFAIEGKALYLATSIGFLNEFRGQKAGLDQNPDYRRALAAVGTEGNGVCYMTPRLFARLRQIPSLNPDADPETKNVLAFALAEIPETTQPLIAERINLPDGILVRSQWYRSMKQDIAMLAVYNPVTIGIAAAMAIPAFNKVKETSQEKAIHNNLQAFASAAQQFMLESGKDTATYEDVVGPDKLVTELKPVAGEDYENLAIHSGDTSISVETAAGKTITYEW